MAKNTAFWNQLLMRSDSISDIPSSADDATNQIIAQLATLTEQFDRVFDPADQFEEYVAVTLCQALQRALTPKTNAPVCKVSVHKPVPAPPALKPQQETQPPRQENKAQSTSLKAVASKKASRDKPVTAEKTPKARKPRGGKSRL